MDLLWPIKWLIELILVSFHTGLSAVGFGFDSGASWVLSIIGLVLVVRAALIPVFVRQIKSQRNMMLVQPELMKLLDALDDDDDVQRVTANFEASDEVMEQL